MHVMQTITAQTYPNRANNARIIPHNDFPNMISSTKYLICQLKGRNMSKFKKITIPSNLMSAERFSLGLSR